MKIEIDSFKSKYNIDVKCCNEKPKVTRTKYGGCWARFYYKCEKCGQRAMFQHWHYESYTPDKKDRDLGFKREQKHTKYTFNLLPKLITRRHRKNFTKARCIKTNKEK